MILFLALSFYLSLSHTLMKGVVSIASFFDQPICLVTNVDK
jgi:hypothetical protein